MFPWNALENDVHSNWIIFVMITFAFVSIWWNSLPFDASLRQYGTHKFEFSIVFTKNFELLTYSCQLTVMVVGKFAKKDILIKYISFRLWMDFEIYYVCILMYNFVQWTDIWYIRIRVSEALLLSVRIVLLFVRCVCVWAKRIVMWEQMLAIKCWMEAAFR